MIKKHSVRWHTWTYAAKMVLFFSLLIIGIIGVHTFCFIHTETIYLQDRLIEDKESFTELLAINLGVAQTVAGFAFQSNLIKEAGETSDTVYVRFVKPNGEIYLSNIVEERGAVIRDLTINTDKTVVNDDIYKGESIKVVVSPVSGGYTVWLGFSLHSVHAAVNERVRDILLVSFGILIIANFVAYFIARRMTYPLTELRKGAEVIGKGDLDYKVDVKSRDEIGGLAEAFNKMTERVKSSIDTETAAREETENIMNTMVETLIVVDSEGNIRNANEATFDLLGYKADELIGKPFTKIMGKKEAEEELERLLKEGSIEDFETTYLTKDGKEIPVSFAASVMKDEDGKLLSSVCTAGDITERMRAEEALRNSEERFRQIAENAQEWIWEVDAIGLYTYASPIVEKMLGYKPEEIVKKKHFYDPFHPEDREGLKKAAFEVFAEKQHFHEFINRNVRKDGEIVWLSTSGVPVLDENGNLLGYRGADTDITERKRAEEELKREKNFSENIIATVPDSLLVLDKDLRIKSANRSFYETFQTEPKEVIDSRIADILSDKDGKLSTELTKLFETEDMLENFEFHYQSEKLGERIFNITARGILVAEEEEEEEEEEELVVLKDITKRKQAEEALQASLREKEELMREIHHRVKNNLQIISSLLDMQARRIKDKKVVDSLSDSRSRIQTMSLIHTQLYQSENFEQVEMYTAIRKLVDFLLEIYAKGKEDITTVVTAKNVILSISQAIPCALIINELVSNALKHAFKGMAKGVIEISMRELTSDKIELVVKDNGVGIPEEFDIYKTKTLGLRLVRTLAESQLKGEMKLNRDEGTKFYIEFNKEG